MSGNRGCRGQVHGQLGFQRAGEALEDGQRRNRATGFEPGHSGLSHARPLRQSGLAQAELFPELTHSPTQLVCQPNGIIDLSVAPGSAIRRSRSSCQSPRCDIPITAAPMRSNRLLASPGHPGEPQLPQLAVELMRVRLTQPRSLLNEQIDVERRRGEVEPCSARRASTGPPVPRYPDSYLRIVYNTLGRQLRAAAQRPLPLPEPRP